MVVAAGGSAACQLFIRGNVATDDVITASTLIDQVVVLEEVPVIDTGDERVEAFAGYAELLATRGRWDHIDNHILASDILIDGCSTAVVAVCVYQLNYAYLHSDYDHLTVTGSQVVGFCVSADPGLRT